MEEDPARAEALLEESREVAHGAEVNDSTFGWMLNHRRHAAQLRGDFERALATARAQLDEEAFAAAWAEGRTMTPEQAIAYALEMSVVDAE